MQGEPCDTSRSRVMSYLSSITETCRNRLYKGVRVIDEMWGGDHEIRNYFSAGIYIAVFAVSDAVDPCCHGRVEISLDRKISTEIRSACS